MPVKTMARPRSSAAAMTSSSRRLPPGWMIAVTPAPAAARRPSAKGKKASEATTEPLVKASARPASRAASSALRAALPARVELAGNYLQGVSMDAAVATGLQAAEAIARGRR